MANIAQPEDKTQEDHNLGQDEFDKLMGKNFSPGDEAAMEERAQEGAAEDSGAGQKPESREGAQATDVGSSDEKARLTEHENQLGDGYKPNNLSRQDKKDARRALFTKRKAALGGGIIGTLVSVFGFFFFQGPLQFVHIAQLMEQFHFSSQEDQSDDRFVKLARYIKYRSSGEVEKTRMGVLQNKVADRIETKMNATGIKSSYSSVLALATDM
jgi:hypothetical protein